MPSTPSNRASIDFVRQGGIYRQTLRQLYEKDLLGPITEKLDYPKALNLPLGVRDFQCSTEALVHGSTTTLSWTERREVFADAIVNDAEEEAETLAAFALASDLNVAFPNVQ